MSVEQSILVVAATSRELATPAHCRTLVCGVGPVDAAAATAAALAAHRPAALLHVGIAGARGASGLLPGTVVIGSLARYCDLNVPSQWAPVEVRPDSALVEAARRVLPGAPVLPIGTSARVGGTTGCDVEAMEGFAVLRAAELAGVPALEVRAISNHIEEPDRALWRFDDAFAAITETTRSLVPALLRTLLSA